MGRLAVIEGLDGAGKRTLADALTKALHDAGATVARYAFPRYGHSVHADLARDALHGRLGDLAESVHGMAVLFALDRRDAAPTIRAELATHDVVLLDRYVASNAAYNAARLGQDGQGQMVAWVRELETDRFAIPVPDVQILLRVPVGVAAGRAAYRERTETARTRDTYESDDGLQRRCAAVYDELTAVGWLAPWQVIDGTAPTIDAGSLADLVLATPPAPIAGSTHSA